MQLLLRPYTDSINTIFFNGEIFIKFNNEDGCQITVAMDVDTVNALIRTLILQLWFKDHLPKYVNRVDEEEPPF